MSRSIRYQNPVVYEHLASQYVAGVMTPLVRARTEALMSATPELRGAVESWANQFAQLQYQLPEESASPQLWDKIEQSITPVDSQKVAYTDEPHHWWDNLLLWRATGLTGIATSLLLALMYFAVPLTPTVEPIAVTSASNAPSYMAAMSAHGQSGDDTIRFVINAYEKTESHPSRIFVQWSQRHPRENQTTLHIWAEDVETGELSYIGVEPEKGQAMNLTKATWTAVSNSGRLIMTADANNPTVSNTLFSGPCVQLSDWRQTI